MSSTFYGFEIAKSGLFASQKAIEVTGHNISNASTTGYTRQKLHLSSIVPTGYNGIVYRGSTNNVGGGVGVDYIEQIRNEFLDSQYRSENSSLADWGVKSDVFYYIEDVFNEPSDSGISTVLSQFYSSLQELSTNADSKDVRNTVRQSAISLCETINYYASQLSEYQDEQDQAIEVTAQEINNIVQQVANLNEQILRYQRNGAEANDLKDKRNLLLDNLSTLIDMSYVEDEHDRVSIYIGKNKANADNKDDLCLLDGLTNQAYSLSVSSDSKKNYYGTENYSTIKLTSKNGAEIEINSNSLTGGKLKGYFDCRDGETSSNVGIPYILGQLDELARGIVNGYNEVHKTGYSIPNAENENKSTNGILFFEVEKGDISKVQANNISISEDIKMSVWNIAASSNKVDFNASDSQESNNEVALKFAKVSSSSNLAYVGNIDDFLASIVADVGVRANQCNDMYDSQEIIVNSVQDLRLSVAGVSIDEEVTNLLAFQKSYAAASRVLTTLDEMLDRLINSTGVVGR